MAKQVGKLAIIERENRIVELLSEGKNPGEIFALVASEQGISPRTVERSYYAVVDNVGKASAARKHELRTMLLARQEHIYRAAMADGDWKLALDVTDKMAKVGGLYVPDKAKEEQVMPKVIEYFEKASDDGK